MLLNTKGIVFKRIKFQESSLIVKIFTREKGIQSFLMKGVLKNLKGKNAGIFQMGIILDLVIYFQENKNLKTLKEYKISILNEQILQDIRKSCMLMFIMELTEKSIKTNSEDKDLYDFISNQITLLNKTNFNPNFHLTYTIQLIQYIGISPQIPKQLTNQEIFDIEEGSFIEKSEANRFSFNQKESRLMYNVLQNTSSIQTREQRKEALQLLLKYFEYHIDGFSKIKSIKVLEEILS